jgi:hypothetical protein
VISFAPDTFEASADNETALIPTLRHHLNMCARSPAMLPEPNHSGLMAVDVHERASAPGTNFEPRERFTAAHRPKEVGVV